MLQYMLLLNHLSGTMINMKASSTVNSGLDSRWNERLKNWYLLLFS